MELVEFLLARIAEDKETAQAASPGPWHLNAECDEVLAVDHITVCEGFALSGPQTRATTTHIARHDPARVLAECEAKRRIVAQWQETAPGMAAWGRVAYGSADEQIIHETLTDDVLPLLALPYADHPDYQPEWKP